MRQKLDIINNYSWLNLSGMTHLVQYVLSLTVLTAAEWHQALPLFHQVRLGLIHKLNNYNGLVIFIIIRGHPTEWWSYWLPKHNHHLSLESSDFIFKNGDILWWFWQRVFLITACMNTAEVKISEPTSLFFFNIWH